MGTCSAYQEGRTAASPPREGAFEFPDWERTAVFRKSKILIFHTEKEPFGGYPTPGAAVC